jgi:hypothetical protein
LQLLVDHVGRSVEDDILVHKLPQYSGAATSKAGKRLEPTALDHAMLPSHMIEAVFASRGVFIWISFPRRDCLSEISPKAAARRQDWSEAELAEHGSCRAQGLDGVTGVVK